VGFSAGSGRYARGKGESRGRFNFCPHLQPRKGGCPPKKGTCPGRNRFHMFAGVASHLAHDVTQLNEREHRETTPPLGGGIQVHKGQVENRLSPNRLPPGRKEEGWTGGGALQQTVGSRVKWTKGFFYRQKKRVN